MVIICAPSPVVSGLPNGASAHPVGERRAGRKCKKKQTTRMLPGVVKTSCSIKATIDTTQVVTRASPKGPQCNPVVHLRDLKYKVEDLIDQMEDTLDTCSISTPALRK